MAKRQRVKGTWRHDAPQKMMIDGEEVDLDALLAEHQVPGLTRGLLYQRLSRGTALAEAFAPVREVGSDYWLVKSLTAEAWGRV